MFSSKDTNAYWSICIIITNHKVLVLLQFTLLPFFRPAVLSRVNEGAKG